MEIMVAVFAFVLFGVLALRYGVDSRESVERDPKLMGMPR